MERHVRIIETAKYLPERIVTTSEIADIIGENGKKLERLSGVKERRYAREDERSSEMGANAIRALFANSSYKKEDIDVIVCASGTADQEIPCTAALIQEQLGWQQSHIPCFDVNATCLSFVTAFDVVSSLIHTGVYHRAIIVSTERASVGLNWNKKDSFILFGDGAAAVIVEKSDGTNGRVIGSHMVTNSSGAHFTEIKGGGSGLHPRHYREETKEDFLFHMDGKKVFKLSYRMMEDFLKTLHQKTSISHLDVEMVVPHQASGHAMELIRKSYGFQEDKFMNIIETHGNQIAASIPTALHEGIVQGKIRRGDKVLLIGTSAGLSIGGLVFEY